MKFPVKIVQRAGELKRTVFGCEAAVFGVDWSMDRTATFRHCYSMANRMLSPVLTRRRIWLACAVALAVDGLQLLLGPMGWWGVDQGLDVVAMILITVTIGFHPLLLPTFVAEFVPALDMLPTWTACTFMVIGLRRKQSVEPAPPPPQSSGPPVIDI